jgi:hypothetical protein
LCAVLKSVPVGARKSSAQAGAARAINAPTHVIVKDKRRVMAFSLVEVNGNRYS